MFFVVAKMEAIFLNDVLKEEIILTCIIYRFVHNMLSKHAVFSLG